MIKGGFKFLRRFLRRENGNMTMEFVFMFPLVFAIFLSSIEMAMYQLGQTFLDRGVGIAARQIRLQTGVNFTHDAVKEYICDNSLFLSECRTTLTLSLKKVNVLEDKNIFKINGLSPDDTCVDISEDITPSTIFNVGAANELMVMRACYMFKPFIPTSTVGMAYEKDGSGRVKMISVSAYVHEPTPL